MCLLTPVGLPPNLKKRANRWSTRTLAWPNCMSWWTDFQVATTSGQAASACGFSQSQRALHVGRIRMVNVL